MKDTPLIITCALVGGELTREQAPFLPLTPDDIAQSAAEAHEAGATMVHLHVRDSEGKPTCRKEIFQQVIKKIRERSDVIIQVSTGGSIGDSFEERLQVLEAAPDMASLTTGSVNFGDDVFLNPRPFVEKLAQRMKEKGIKPEIEVFDTAMLEIALNLAEKGLVEKPLHIDLVLAVPGGGIAANEVNLDFLIEKIPPDATWSVAAIGRHEFPMAELAIKKGGHVRVGMEDNIYLEKGVMAKSNAELVEKVIELAKKFHRPVATTIEARKILRINSRY